MKSFTRTALGKPLVQTESWMEWNGSAWAQKLRVRSNTYSPDGVDLLEERDGSNQLIQKYGWDTSHRLTSLREYYQYTTDPNTGYYESLYGYDSSGRLVSENLPTGLATYWAYPTPPLNHAAGYYVTISRSPVGGSENEFWQYGQMKSTTDARGLVRQFTWDALNRLTRTTYPDTTYTETTYVRLSDSQKILDPVTVRDWMGFVRLYEYDSMRRKTKITDERGKITIFTYCACGSPDTITGPVGNIVAHEYDYVGRRKKTQWKDSIGTVKAEKTYDYDIWGQPALEIDGTANGNSRRYTYDNRGLRTVIEAQTGTGTGSSWARLGRSIYDIDGRPTTAIDRNGVKVTQTFDRMDRVLTRTQPAAAGGGSTTTETFGYSALGRTSWIDLDNKTWTYAYDQLRRKTSETEPDTDGNPNNDTTSYAYNNAGDLLTLTDPRGKVTTWVYDNHGRMTSKTYAGDGFANVTYGYDVNSRLTWRRFYANASSYRETAYTYDNSGNLTLVNYPGSTDLTYVYDDAGRLQSMTDASGTTAFTYTEWNALKTEDGPWSGITDRLTYDYSTGRRLTGVTVEQPSGTMAVTYSPDLAGRIAGVVSPAGTFSSTFLAPSLADFAAGASSTYAASLADSVSIPNSGIIDLDYDLRGRLKFTELKTGGGTTLNKDSYLYNTANRRTRHTRTDTGFTAYAYDAIGQIDTAMATLPDQTSNDTAERLDYGYDAGWNMTGRTSNGTPLSYSVNDRNQVTVEPNLNYAYDANGNRIGQSTTTSATQYGFDDENQLVSVTRGTLGRSTFVYDGKLRRRLTREYTWSAGSAAALIANGAITAPTRNNFSGWVGTVIQVGASPLVVTELGRWKLSGNSGTHTVRIVKHDDQKDVPGGSAMVSLAGGTVGTFVYAALPAAVVLEANTKYYVLAQEANGGDTWYDGNQPVTVSGGITVSSSIWSYGDGVYYVYGSGSTSYGPVGLKGATGTWSLASETRYIYDGMRVIQERNSAGTPTVAYTRGPDLSGTLEGSGGIGGLLARSVWNGSSWASPAFYHNDGNGNVTALAEPSSGSIVLSASYRYDPFGRLIGTPSGLAAANAYRFSSKDWHNASGLYYYGYRFYDPQTARWINGDPIVENGHLTLRKQKWHFRSAPNDIFGNRYRYVDNSPCIFIDPNGLIPTVDSITFSVINCAKQPGMSVQSCLCLIITPDEASNKECGDKADLCFSGGKMDLFCLCKKGCEIVAEHEGLDGQFVKECQKACDVSGKLKKACEIRNKKPRTSEDPTGEKAPPKESERPSIP